MGRCTRKRHHGGKMVSKGAYGCGFIPALKCVGNVNRSPATFSKFMEAKDAEEEWASRDVVAVIDPKQQFTLYPTRICNIDVAALTAQNDIGSCGDRILAHINPATFAANIKTKYKLLQVPQADASLHHLNIPQELKGAFFKSFRNLFNALIFMHDDNFFHLDIKPLNIMANFNKSSQDYTLRLIDFGLSRTLDQFIKERNKTIRSNYLYWPFHFRFLVHRNKMLTDQEQISEMIKEDLQDYYANVQQYGFLPDGVLRSYGRHVDVYNKMREDATKNGIESMVRTNLEKVDVFSLGITLAEMVAKHLNVIHRAGHFYLMNGRYAMLINDPDDINIYKILFEVIQKMIHYDPYERVTAREARVLYNEALDNLIENVENSTRHNVSNASPPNSPNQKPSKNAKAGTKRKRRNNSPAVPQQQLNNAFIQENRNSKSNGTATTLNLNNIIEQKKKKAKRATPGNNPNSL